MFLPLFVARAENEIIYFLLLCGCQVYSHALYHLSATGHSGVLERVILLLTLATFFIIATVRCLTNQLNMLLCQSLAVVEVAEKLQGRFQGVVVWEARSNPGKLPHYYSHGNCMLEQRQG